MSKDISDKKALALQDCSRAVLRMIRQDLKLFDVHEWTEQFEQTIKSLSTYQIKTLTNLFISLPSIAKGIEL